VTFCRQPDEVAAAYYPWAMPNAFTRVPDAAVPPPGRFGSAVIPVADVFMVAMFSKPPSGTLRTTWVTPSTYWMTLATFLGAVVIAGLLLSGVIGGVTTISLVGVLVCLLFAVGAGSVALVGGAQRRAKVRASA
jgi:hypothetical protein